MDTRTNVNTSTNGSAAVSAGKEAVLMVVESCFLVILNIAALVGNLLVCLAFYKNPSLRTITNYFVLSLAITDLSMATLVMPFYTASTIIGKKIGGILGCQIELPIYSFLAGTSLITVMLLAINRFFCVVRPEQYTNIFSKKRSVAMALSAWILILVSNTIQILVTGLQFENNISGAPALCIPTISSASILTVFNVLQNSFIVVPSLVVVVCYVKIYRAVRHHNTAAASTPQRAHSGYGVEEAKITRTLTIIVVGFYICWLPVLLTNLLRFLKAIGASSMKFYNFYNVLPLFASSAINPMIYATTSNSFRNEFIKRLRCEP